MSRLELQASALWRAAIAARSGHSILRLCGAENLDVIAHCHDERIRSRAISLRLSVENQRAGIHAQNRADWFSTRPRFTAADVDSVGYPELPA